MVALKHVFPCLLFNELYSGINKVLNEAEMATILLEYCAIFICYMWKRPEWST